MTEVYLGQPPKRIKDWIIAHHSSGDGLDKLLRFTATEAGASVRMNRMLNWKIDNTTEDSDDTKLINLQYSLNGGSWSKYTIGTTINLDENSYVEFKALGSNETISKSDENFYQFVIDKKVNASGNIQSILVEDAFKDKKNVQAWCYYYMFDGCASLQTAPRLPATTLAAWCYSCMFEGCTNLQTAPDLPAPTLADSCYKNMFAGCTNLQTAPDLPATTLADYCYQFMFCECSSLQTAPDLPATTLAARCYSSMFEGCTSLQTAPDLPATTLADSCYNFMFQRCTKFDSVNMKKSMEGVYSKYTHGDTTKTINYVLD